MRHSIRSAYLTGPLTVLALLALGTTTLHAQSGRNSSPYYYGPVPSYAPPSNTYASPRPTPGYAAPAAPGPVRYLPSRTLRPLQNHEYGKKESYMYKS